MDFSRYSEMNSYSRDELVKRISHALEQLSYSELEALYYEMLTKDYIRE